MPKHISDHDTIDSDGNNDDLNDEILDSRHQRLRKHPTLWAFVGVLHTLLTAGIIFGWASLLPVLREEGVDHSPQEFSAVFTAAAIGNYLSTLVFGTLLDRRGPRLTGILAAILFAIGLLLSSMIQSLPSLAVGFALLGFAGPGIQLPTLHLANLFQAGSGGGGGGGGGGAFFMSAQAAAFDGGTAIFAILRLLASSSLGLSASAFLRLYLVVPVWVWLTAIFIWPDGILEDSDNQDDNDESHIDQLLGNNSRTLSERSYVGPGSPYLSSQRRSSKQQAPQPQRQPRPNRSLVNAPLRVVLRNPAFWSLAIWVSVHILKLNFIVATINDQLNAQPTLSDAQTERLIDIFGAMLPFGFVVLPIVAMLLDRSALWALQVANMVGLIYGGVLVLFPGFTVLQVLLVFPSVATSRQLVYSTIFHQIGQVFGFANYGVLLGLTNLCVSSLSVAQTPLVDWAETVGTYVGPNTVLWVATVPLLVLVLWSDPTPTSSSSSTTAATAISKLNGETAPLRGKGEDIEGELVPKRYSYV